jgi:hypothetical protein
MMATGHADHLCTGARQRRAGIVVMVFDAVDALNYIRADRLEVIPGVSVLAFGLQAQTPSERDPIVDLVRHGQK